MRYALAAVCLALLAQGAHAAPAHAEAPATAAPGWLSVRGQYIVDAENRPFVLCGTAFLLSGTWKDYPRPAAEMIRYYAALGLNCFRLCFYVTPRVLKDRTFAQYVDDDLEPAIAACRRAGVYAILDMHEYRHNPGGGSGGEAYPDFRRDWLASWRYLAHRYRNEPAVAAYELWNEPDIVAGGRQKPEQTRAWLQQAIDAVRAIDRRHILIVNGDQGGFGPQTPITWGSDVHYDPNGPSISFGDVAKWHNPDPARRLVFAFHMGFFETNRKMGPNILPYHIANHRAILRAFSDTYRVPVLCTEWEDEPPQTATRAFTVAAADWFGSEPRHIGWILFRCHTTADLEWHYRQGYQPRGGLDPPFADVWLPLAREMAGPCADGGK